MALVLLAASAELNYADAQYFLAICYTEGRGVEKNFDEAFKLLRLAADQKHPDAAYIVGEAYYQGDSVEKDQAKAIVYWKSAAENGSEEAKKKLESLK